MTEQEPEVQVVSNDEYQAMYPDSLFPEIRDSDWYSPKQPDSRLTDLIHREHRGHISFHRLSSTVKNQKGKPLFQDLYSLKAKDVKEHFQKIAPDLQHDSFFSINGMNRAGFNDSRVRSEFKFKRRISDFMLRRYRLLGSWGYCWICDWSGHRCF